MNRLISYGIGAASLAVAVSATGVVVANAGTSSPSAASSKTYLACLTKHTHHLVNVTVSPATPAACPAHTKSVSWNKTGPAGVAGPQGPGGSPGTPGTAGPAGPAGVQSLVATTSLQAGNGDCSTGGVRVDSGQDSNGDGTLEPSEITSTRDVCNGVNGSQGPAGPSGLDYTRIITVSPTDSATPTDNGTALLDAVAAASKEKPAPSATDPYEIFVEPGSYDLDGQTLSLPSDISLTGAGEELTTVTSTDTPGGCTLQGDGGSEVTDLTVINIGGSGQSFGYCNEGSGTATLRNVTLTANGASDDATIGLNMPDNDETVIADNVTSTASGGGYDDFGAYVGGATLIATNSEFSGSDGQSKTSYGTGGLGTALGISRITDSQVVGGSTNNAGTVTCIYDYGVNYTALDDTCN